MNRYAVRVSFRYADAQGIMLEDLRYINAECGIDALILIEDALESRGFKDILFKGLRDITHNVWIIDEKSSNERFIECKWIEFNQLRDLLEMERRINHGTLD